MFGDGSKDSVSLYTTNLHAGISRNLTSEGLEHKIKKAIFYIEDN